MNNYGIRVEYVEYSVKKGDSLYAIAKTFNTTVSELIDINMLTSNTLFPGQVLLVPKKSATDSGYDFYIYNTVEGDTIERISDKENIDPVLLGLYNDFGKLKQFLDQYGPTPRGIISQKTGLTMEQIDAFLKKGMVEIQDGEKYYLLCEKCGCDIRYGRFCPECSKYEVIGNMKASYQDIGEKPKFKNLDMDGKMHYLNRKGNKENRK